ncbi:hypothetical protein Salat_0878700 [Sesamum alatum]|uniref:Uncharacterized protein n=1 Tax=Sesamum alatum TaxID=300844 RepID=A0AAE2CQU3_9LAMI|nr:hypothetical protein Salat_0878700 [Sesamum alatum]
MEDEAEIFEGLISQFLLSFDKLSRSETPLELIHNTTRWAAVVATTSIAVNSDKPFASTSSDKANANPKKKAKEDELIGPSRRPLSSEEDGSVIIVPPRLPPGSGVVDEDDEPVIGPPRPPPVGDGEDEPMVGLPRPPHFYMESNSDKD